MKCELYNAIDLGIDTEDWEFTKMDCTYENDKFILVKSESTEAEFYLEKTINYGDIILIVFLSIFTIAIICKWIAEFVFKKR